MYLVSSCNNLIVCYCCCNDHTGSGYGSVRVLSLPFF